MGDPESSLTSQHPRRVSFFFSSRRRHTRYKLEIGLGIPAEPLFRSLDDLAKYYDETILRIRAAAPTASILILGPPDTATREAGKSCERMASKPEDRKSVV